MLFLLIVSMGLIISCEKDEPINPIDPTDQYMDKLSNGDVFVHINPSEDHRKNFTYIYNNGDFDEGSNNQFETLKYEMLNDTVLKATYKGGTGEYVVKANKIGIKYSEYGTFSDQPNLDGICNGLWLFEDGPATTIVGMDSKTKKVLIYISKVYGTGRDTLFTRNYTISYNSIGVPRFTYEQPWGESTSMTMYPYFHSETHGYHSGKCGWLHIISSWASPYSGFVMLNDKTDKKNFTFY